MMRTIHMHGALGDRFAREVTLDVRDTGEAIRALAANFPGFLAYIRDRAWHVIRGRNTDDGQYLTEDELLLGLGNDDLHMVPVVEGSGGGASGARNKGIAAIVLGVILIAVGIIVPGAQFLILPGIALLASGAAALLSPTPSLDNAAIQSRESPDQRPSFLFNGPVNTIEQGGPVPVIYGQLRVGAVLVSAGIEVEQLGNTA